MIGPQAHGGVAVFNIDPTETRPNYKTIIFQDLLSESKFEIKIKIINYLIYWVNNQGLKQIKQSPNPNVN